MDRKDWLMLLIAFEGAPRGLDPVRLQKGMFLFGMEAEGVGEEQLYAFRPYNYGPMSREVYADVDELVRDGLVEETPVEGQSWSRYRATPRGVDHGGTLVEQGRREHADAVQLLFDVKQSVASRSFAALLEDVYERYPDYASRSIFRRRA
jgi:uncharacterized protein